MSSRLRRMLLVNSRTSGSLSSGAINEVDPRKGAAVTGENSVGKTTTLELIPLFFGTLPSQIAESGGGREPMLRFVLPTPQSAIVFEYQRGDDEEHDVRCVVIRRPSSSEAAEYRFIRGPFNEDLFTMCASEGTKVFTDDAQLVEAARARSVAISRKLSTSDYRSVILGLKAMNHDARELRVMSGDYSFGSRGRGLPHLDRLISAVVKERVNFRDFIHVSVTMIQDAIGGAAGAGLDRNKFSLRQSRSQIERWLDDRDACEAAFKLEARIAKLRETIGGFIRAEAQLRDEKQQIPLLLDVCSQALSVRKAALESLIATRKEEISTEGDTLGRLEKEVGNARHEAQQSEQSRHSEELRRDSLQLGMVEDWAAQLDQVPGLKIQLGQIDEQIRTAQGKSDGIVQSYERQINDVELAAAREDGRLQDFKNGPQERFAAEQVDFERVKNTRLREAEDAHGQSQRDLNEAASAISERIGQAKALAEHSSASQVTLDAVSLAESNSEAHQSNLQQASERARQANETVVKAQAAYRMAETYQTEAHRQKQVAETSLESTQTLLTPDDGTLLLSLRAAAPSSWQATLARVLAPDLLKRRDLAPQFLQDEVSETVYGWSLATDKIELPVWADDEALRNQVAVAQDLVKSTAQATLAANTELARASLVLDAVKKAHGIADSELSVLQGKTAGMQEAVKLAKARRDREAQEARKTAQNQIAGLVLEQQGVSAQLSVHAQRYQAERDTIAQETAHQLAQAQKRYTAAIQAIEDQRAASNEAAVKRKANLESQRDDHLANEKVDVIRLNGLRTERAALVSAIQKIEGREPTVMLWRIWLAEGGHSLIEGLKAVELVKKKVQDQATEILETHECNMSQSRERFSQGQSDLSDDVERLQSDVHMLSNLLDQHPTSRGGVTLLDPHRSASSLRARIADLDAAAGRAEDQVRQQYRSLKEELTGRPSSVKELVEQSLLEFSGQSVIRQADELCTVCRTLGRKIVPNLNNEVAAILEHIRQFRKKITDFQTEAVRYNNRLQAGLDSVAGFNLNP